jgi:hypothetical protein
METKRCSKCKKEYLLNNINFKPNKRHKDGLTSICRYCKRKIDRIYSRKYREQNPEWKKENNKKNGALVLKLVKKYYKKYPERLIAQQIINKKKRQNKLKILPCLICHSKENIVAHHPDYNKPLEVIWLCQKCHQRLHGNLKALSEAPLIRKI